MCQRHATRGCATSSPDGVIATPDSKFESLQDKLSNSSQHTWVKWDRTKVILAKQNLSEHLSEKMADFLPLLWHYGWINVNVCAFEKLMSVLNAYDEMFSTVVLRYLSLQSSQKRENIWRQWTYLNCIISKNVSVCFTCRTGRLNWRLYYCPCFCRWVMAYLSIILYVIIW